MRASSLVLYPERDLLLVLGTIHRRTFHRIGWLKQDDDNASALLILPHRSSSTLERLLLAGTRRQCVPPAHFDHPSLLNRSFFMCTIKCFAISLSLALLQNKVLVFVSTCKQARFCYEALRRLRPGVPLRALHGKMKQMRRLSAFYEFSEVCTTSADILLVHRHSK